MTDFNELKASIKIGMKRAEVEKHLPTRDGGLQESTLTRYVATPRMIVEIPFDSTGGPWSPDNRVLSEIRLSHQEIHLD